MSKKKWIVLTSINNPTDAVKELALIALERNWGMVLVGDTKSPTDWHVDGVDYLSIDKQNRLFPEYSKKAPTKHYSRKNFGYLYAIAQGAEVIIETDDDNRPYPNFAENLDITVSGLKVGGTDWLNVYSHFTDSLIWPRGLPLDRIHNLGLILDSKTTGISPIQQSLADADPDVDAIFRLIYKDSFHFDRTSENVLVSKNTFCPFNSQNTIFFPEAFDLLYLPSYVSFRMTDIWRSFVAQRVIWERGYEVSFHSPTVYQERNQHNLMRDFDDEVVGYLRNTEIANCLLDLDLGGLSEGEALLNCYSALNKIGIVPDEELVILDLWINNLSRVFKR